MNRRKTITRRTRLLDLFVRPRNRRTRPSSLHERVSKASAAVEAQPRRGGGEGKRRRPALDLKAAGRQVLRVALVTIKVAAVLAVLGGVGLGGFYAYQRIIATTYFNVDAIEVLGARQASIKELTGMVASIKGRNIFTADLDAIRRSVSGHPWVKEARVARLLPRTVRIEVEEHRAVALLLMGHLYVVSSEGKVIKRADPDEQEGLPVITGIERMAYLNHPAAARARIDKALAALARYYDRVRPKVSEINVNEDGALTLYMQRGGVAVRMGAELTEERLNKLDAVWAALGPEVRRARVLFLDNEARADRVTVRMGRYQ